MLDFPLRKSSVCQHYSGIVTEHRLTSEPGSMQKSLLSLPLDTAWLLLSLSVLVSLSYGPIPSVSDASGHEVTTPHSRVALYCLSLTAAVRPRSWVWRLEVVGRSPAISDCLRSGCVVREIKAMRDINYKEQGLQGQVEMCLALASTMVPCPRTEASFFWGLSPSMDSLSKAPISHYVPMGREGFCRSLLGS